MEPYENIHLLLSAILQEVDVIDPEAAFSKRNKIALKENINRLVEEAKQLLRESATKTKTYASVTAATVTTSSLDMPTTTPTTTHSIMVYPKENMNSMQTRSALKSKINFSQLKIGINGVKNLSNGGLMVYTPTEAAANTLQEHLKKEDDLFDVKITRKRDPCVIIYGIEKDVEGIGLVEAVRTQNDLATLQENALDSFTVRKIIKSGNEYNYHAVVQVSPETYKELVGKRNVYIGMTRCAIKKFTWVTRCFKCQAYGHTQQNCRNNEEICGKCAGMHQTRECSAKKNCCANCNRHNDRLKLQRAEKSSNKRLSRDNNHSAFDKACPSFQESIIITDNRTNYG